MVFTYTDHAFALTVDGAIGIAHTSGGCEGLWLTTGYMTVEALVKKVGEIDDAIPDGEGAATVFVDTGAHVKRRRGHISDVTIGRATDNGYTAPLGWPRFSPVEVLSVEQDFT